MSLCDLTDSCDGMTRGIMAMRIRAEETRPAPLLRAASMLLLRAAGTKYTRPQVPKSWPFAVRDWPRDATPLVSQILATRLIIEARRRGEVGDVDELADPLGYHEDTTTMPMPPIRRLGQHIDEIA